MKTSLAHGDGRFRSLLFPAAVGGVLAFPAVSATYEAAPVTRAEVAAAVVSRPQEDSREIVRRLVKREVSAWETQGRVPGRIVFEETFAPDAFETRWGLTVPNASRISEDGRGGTCATVLPQAGVFSGFSLRESAFVPLDPEKPYAVLYEVRTPEGGYPPLIRLDCLDADKRNLNCPVQFESAVDATQPTIFHRNAVVVPTGRPATARFLQVRFFIPPEWDKPGMIGNVRVVDLSDAVTARLSASGPVRAEREAAGAHDVLVYCDDNVSASYPVLPLSAHVPGRAGATLRLREFPGEKTRATAVLWSKSAWTNMTVSFSDLRGPADGQGAIPSSCMSAQVLKAHYQGASAPEGLGVPDTRMALVPELLLNDDALVIPDCARGRNLVKYRTAEGASRYVDINTVWNRTWAEPIPAEDMPIEDARTLQPFALRAGLNKQLVLTVRVPSDAGPGRYAGRATFACGGRVAAELPIELEVLPLRLPEEAETVYSADRAYTMGLYVWGELDPQDSHLIGPLHRSREQLLNEYRTLVDYSILDPIFIWTPETVFDDQAFRRHLDVVREAGFKTSTLHLGGSGHLGNATNAVELAAMQSRLRRAMDTARAYGFDDVYFYGFDEVRGAALLSQRTAWAAARATGAKTMVSGYVEHFQMVGDLLDLIVYADTEGTANPGDWHRVGARIWKYNTPQAYCEDPAIMRRNYGLALWKRGFDGASTYCNFGDSVCWNDVASRLRQDRCGGRAFGRQIAIVYPTRNGVVPTAALAGLESAIKDVRIFSLLRRLARQKGRRDAQAWFESLDFASCDLAEARRKAVDWILRLQKEPSSLAKTVELFNGRDLSGWHTWLDGRGRNNDPKKVFSVTNGVLRITGEEFGGLVTEAEYRDYRLDVEYRWLGTRFREKAGKALDSGILFHSTGPDGGFCGFWMFSHEYNLIVGASGDIWTVGCKKLRPDMVAVGEAADEQLYDPTTGGRFAIWREGGREVRLSGNERLCRFDIARDWTDTSDAKPAVNENPIGEWNLATLICRGDRVECRFNGKLVNRLVRVWPDYGRIQLQSEACGVEFRRVTLSPLSDAPEEPTARRARK